MRERSGVAHDRAVMPLRVGFADTLSGQLHFRACGAGPDIVLLPWSPASGRMYDAVLPHLARAGFRAIAFDLAGTGRSHKKCRNWTPQQYATDVLEAASEREDERARADLFENTTARDLMTPKPITISADADVREAAQQMLYAEVKRLFVEDGKRLVGVISQTDLAYAVGTGRL